MYVVVVSLCIKRGWIGVSKLNPPIRAFFFRQIRQSANIFDQIRKVNLNAIVTSNQLQK